MLLFVLPLQYLTSPDWTNLVELVLRCITIWIFKILFYTQSRPQKEEAPQHCFCSIETIVPEQMLYRVHVHVYSIHCICKSVHFINYSNCVIKQKTNPGPERTQAGHRRNKSESTPFPRHCSVVLVFALTLIVLALSSLSSVFPGCHCVVFISILSTLASTV